MSAYASVSRVQTILDSAVDLDAETFAALNETASGELDAACRVTGFGTDAEPSTFYLAPATGGAVLVLDPPALAVDVVDDNGTARRRGLPPDLAGRSALLRP